MGIALEKCAANYMLIITYACTYLCSLKLLIITGIGYTDLITHDIMELFRRTLNNWWRASLLILAHVQGWVLRVRAPECLSWIQLLSSRISGDETGNAKLLLALRSVNNAATASTRPRSLHSLKMAANSNLTCSIREHTYIPALASMLRIVNGPNKLLQTNMKLFFPSDPCIPDC